MLSARIIRISENKQFFLDCQYINHIVMLIFDILLISCAFCLLVSLWFRKHHKTFLILAAIVLFLQLIVEGYHWQMIPVYTALFLAAVLYLFKPDKKWIEYPGLAMVLLLIVTGSALAYLIPVFHFPKPTGNYTVGLRHLYLQDSTRLDHISEAQGDFRKLTVNVWYPSHEIIDSPEPYLNEGYNFAYARSIAMPEVIVSHFSKIKTHTQKDIAMAPNRMPVILLSHGLGWNSEMYTSLISELVSRGYIVFGVDHTYEAALTIYDGEKIHLDQKTLDAMDENLNFDAFEPLLEDFKNEEDPLQKRLKLQKMVRILPYNESFDRWTADISFVLDQMEENNENKESFLFQKLNTQKIGMMGHSWGGAAVVQSASLDPRAKAVINMDGAQWGTVIDTTLTTPLMAIFPERNYDEFFTPNFFVYDQITQKDYYEVTIPRTGHASFGDIPYWTRMPEFTDTGEIDPGKLTFITADLIHSFFRKFVEQEEVDLLEDLKYSEIHLEKKR